MQGVSVIRGAVVKTVRLDRRLRERLRLAARATSRTESELMREAVERACEEVLSGQSDEPLADLIGSVRGDGSGYSRRTSREFGDLLLKEARRRRRR
jgi:hypothetical protein